MILLRREYRIDYQFFLYLYYGKYILRIFVSRNPKIILSKGKNVNIISIVMISIIELRDEADR